MPQKANFMQKPILTPIDYIAALKRLKEIWNMDACHVDTREAETLLAAITEYEIQNNIPK